MNGARGSCSKGLPGGGEPWDGRAGSGGGGQNQQGAVAQVAEPPSTSFIQQKVRVFLSLRRMGATDNPDSRGMCTYLLDGFEYRPSYQLSSWCFTGKLKPEEERFLQQYAPAALLRATAAASHDTGVDDDVMVLNWPGADEEKK